MKTLIRFLKDQSGSSAAEYAMILAVAGVGIVSATGVLGSAIANRMNATATVLASSH